MDSQAAIVSAPHQNLYKHPLHILSGRATCYRAQTEEVFFLPVWWKTSIRWCVISIFPWWNPLIPIQVLLGLRHMYFSLQKTWSVTQAAQTASVPAHPWSPLTSRAESRCGTWWRTMSTVTRKRVTGVARWFLRSTWQDYLPPRYIVGVGKRVRNVFLKAVVELLAYQKWETSQTVQKGDKYRRKTEQEECSRHEGKELEFRKQGQKKDTGHQ